MNHSTIIPPCTSRPQNGSDNDRSASAKESPRFIQRKLSFGYLSPWDLTSEQEQELIMSLADLLVAMLEEGLDR